MSPAFSVGAFCHRNGMAGARPRNPGLSSAPKMSSIGGASSAAGPYGFGSILGCFWVGSLDFNFLVEIKVGFPLNPQKVKLTFCRGVVAATKLEAFAILEPKVNRS